MSNYTQQLFVDREKKVRGFQKLLQPATRQAVMLIEAAQDMGKSWLVSYMQSHCLAPDVSVPAAHVDFRNPRQIHEIQDALGLIRLLRDKLEAPEYFQDLNRTINQFTGGHAPRDPALAGLARQLTDHFNLDELAGLCLDLGINFEFLSGDTLPAKARALAQYAERHSLLAGLREACAARRPNVDWKGEETAVSPTPDDAASETAVADQGAPLLAGSDVERRHAERQINDAFFAAVARLMADKGQLVFLLDSYEAAPQEAEDWIREQLLLRLGESEIEDAVVIITGRKTPDLSDLPLNHLLVQTGLDPFTEEHIREYFEERRQISGLDWQTIVLTSGGVPGALAMMADHALATQSEEDDFFTDL